MKINNILINNFRGFNNRFFEFDPKMNVVLGDNTTGKTTLLHAIESTSASGFQKQYPHPFLTPSLYSPHPLSKERWGYSKRGVEGYIKP